MRIASPFRYRGMSLNQRQALNAGRSPYPGRGLYGQRIAEKGNRYWAEQGYEKLEDRDLQHPARLAFLARLTSLTLLGMAFHIVAAVYVHILHQCHVRRFHWARFCP